MVTVGGENEEDWVWWVGMSWMDIVAVGAELMDKKQKRDGIGLSYIPVLRLDEMHGRS